MIEIEPASAGSVFGSGLDLARRYAQMVAGAGVERGLIGPREAQRIWSRHLLNCAVLAELIAGGTVLDVGSGAGLPGIPLAIVRPECTVTLVEPLERRTVFLKEVVSELSLENVTVVRGRADEVTDQYSSADFVTSRAVAPLAKLASWSVPLARRGGQVLAIKGASAATEIERDGAAAGRLGLAELEVLMIGATVVQPPTTVIRGVVVGTAGRRRPGAWH